MSSSFHIPRPPAHHGSRRGSAVSDLGADRFADVQPRSRRGSAVSLGGRSDLSTHTDVQMQQHGRQLSVVASPAAVMQRFQASQREHEQRENLKAADRLQQRLVWKEQMERSAALEAQLMANRKTTAQLERQLEQVKRELAGERARYDADLATKQARLRDAEASLRGRKKRLDAANHELDESRFAVARMRATLVENFVLDVGGHSFAVADDAQAPSLKQPLRRGKQAADSGERDYLHYHTLAPELEQRHRTIVSRYVGAGAGGDGSSSVAGADAAAEDRVFAADPLFGARPVDRKAAQRAAKELQAQLRMASLGGPTTGSDGVADAPHTVVHPQHQQQQQQQQPGGGRAAAAPSKALSEVREMLLNLEKEMLEAERPAVAVPSKQLSSSRRRDDV